MRKFLLLTAALMACLGIAACGGSGHRHVNKTQRPACPKGLYLTKVGCSPHSPTFGLPPKSVTLPRPSTTQTVVMLDSISPFSVFNGLSYRGLGGYPFGSFVSYWDYRSHFPVVVAVDVQAFDFGIHGAAISCLDVEPGDAATSQVTGWLQHEVNVLGFRRPCVYGSLSEWPGINAAIVAAHLSVHVYRWDADWTGAAHLDSGFDATQWNNSFAGRNIDPDAATLAFLNLLPKPPPPPPECFGKGAQRSATCTRVTVQVGALNQDKVWTWNAGIHLSQAMGALHCSVPRKRTACQSLEASRVVLLKDLAYDKTHAAALVKEYS